MVAGGAGREDAGTREEACGAGSVLACCADCAFSCIIVDDRLRFGVLTMVTAAPAAATANIAAAFATALAATMNILV